MEEKKSYNRKITSAASNVYKNIFNKEKLALKNVILAGITAGVFYANTFVDSGSSRLNETGISQKQDSTQLNADTSQFTAKTSDTLNTLIYLENLENSMDTTKYVNSKDTRKDIKILSDTLHKETIYSPSISDMLGYEFNTHLSKKNLFKNNNSANDENSDVLKGYTFNRKLGKNFDAFIINEDSIRKDTNLSSILSGEDNHYYHDDYDDIKEIAEKRIESRNKFIRDFETLKRLELEVKEKINFYSATNDGIFKDNEFYESRRIVENNLQKEKYLGKNFDGTVLIINKTFQKAMLQTPDTTYEWDCSTALKYGSKKRNGDGKTPEGLFHIESIAASQFNTYDGLKAYGPYFCRLDDPVFRSIGLHGNGTDTVKVRNWRNDRQYMPPDPLGVNSNNFAYGVSHGCIRLPNDVIREKIEDRTIRQGMPIIIYEDLFMSEHLKKNYIEQADLKIFKKNNAENALNDYKNASDNDRNTLKTVNEKNDDVSTKEKNMYVKKM